MAAANDTVLSETATEAVEEPELTSDIEIDSSYQGPHDWRKRLKPVKSPIKEGAPEVLINGVAKGYADDRPRSRPLPPWKRDLIERNKKVARLVRRESSGRSKVVRRESSGRSKKGNESPSAAGIGRKKSSSFRGGQPGENTFTQQVVNETPRLGRRISPHNSFKSSGSVRRTPSDKCLDPSDPNTKKRVERVRRARLYLLQQMGPNSFQIVGDSPEHKFRVFIGPQTCSCGRGPHCVHVLFVMLRVFQVSETDPCLWTKQLKNYEVENLFRIYNDKRNLRIEAKKLKRNHKLSPAGSNTPSPEASVAPSESDAGSVREEDDTCPICLLEMVEGESLLRCDGCQNRLHHHCITVWFEECKRQSEHFICPLCRARWKQSDSVVKTEDGSTEPVTDPPPLVPPNTRAPSPQPLLQSEVETSRLPYAEPIPGEYINMATPWMELLGEDLVSCLFSRNWSIRETGLKHLAKEVSRELGKVTGPEGRGAGGLSLANEAAMLQLLECCFNVIAFTSMDPVYKVFVGCLKVLRSVFAVTPSRDHQQRAKLQALFRPVVDAIVVKCTDGNRRTSQLSISTILELAKGQHGELRVGRDLASPGTLGLGGMSYLVRVLTEKYDPAQVPWQWLLGRLYVIEKLVIEFPTEFLPRQRPDGASSESSLELIGATSGIEEERPQNYDRLLVVAEFTIKAVSNRHQRISRVAKRVFLLSARYAAHLDNLIAEFEVLIAELEYSHKKSLRRQLDKIVADFALSEKLGRQLLQSHNDDTSLSDTPTETPVSSPRCSSPVTTISDNFSEGGAQLEKNHPVVPPNTPIRDRRQQMRAEHFRRSFDLLEEEKASDTKHRPKMRTSKSLDNLNKSGDLKPLSLPAKSSTLNKKKSRSRSRSNTPQRIGRVLETNLDEVIKMEDQKKQSREGLNLSDTSSTIAMDLSLSDRSTAMVGEVSPSETSTTSILSPLLPPLDLETCIDTNTEVLSLDKVNEKVHNDTDKTVGPVRHRQHTLRNPNCNSAHLPETPKLRSKIPKSLSLNLDLDLTNHNHASSLPSARGRDLEKIGSASSNDGASSAPITSPQTNCMLLTAATAAATTETGCQTSTSLIKGTTMPDACKSPSSKSPNSKGCKSKDCSQAYTFSVYDEKKRQTPPSQKSEHTDNLLRYMATTPCTGNEKPVTFQTEVAMATPKHSPSHTLDREEDDCHCKEEVEKEEALALARAMELSSQDPPTPRVPGLTPLDTHEVITVRIQPDDCDVVDSNGNPPSLYYENVHWLKGPLLGTGAFSTCYQTRDVQTGTIMAMKQISFCRNSKTEQESVIETITEEIHMMAKLNHPHIVRILGATRQGCHFNMFVEWMPGGSVSYLLGQYGCFSEDVITSYVLQIMRGLAYLHENHILHRDLKGANLLVDSTGHRLRIGDFGAAARLASKTTGAGEFQGQLLGTIAFMAPEVLRGETYGRACDVWSVGCCVIEMATTKPPWNAHDISNHLALIFKIANSASTPPIPEKLSPPLRDVLLRCLETVKEDRPTAKELLIHPLFTQYMQKKKGSAL